VFRDTSALPTEPMVAQAISGFDGQESQLMTFAGGSARVYAMLLDVDDNFGVCGNWQTAVEQFEFIIGK